VGGNDALEPVSHRLHALSSTESADDGIERAGTGRASRAL